MTWFVLRINIRSHYEPIALAAEELLMTIPILALAHQVPIKDLVPSKGPVKTRHIIYFLAALFGVSVIGALVLAARSPASPIPPTSSIPALTVKPTFARIEQWPQGLHAMGNIVAWQEVVIGAEIGGQRLAQLFVDIGDFVQQGQLLAQLSAGTPEAELDASQALLQEAEINAAEALRAANRAQALQASKMLSAQTIEQALTANEAAQARLAAARARVQADRLRLAYTQVRAPDDGVISARVAVEGALLPQGAEIMRLQRQGRLEWQAEMPGSELAHVRPGQAVRLSLSDSQFVEGRVRTIAPQVDPQTRTGLVHVDLEPATQIRAGQFARGEILLEQREVLTLPETAVLLRDGFNYVFRIEDDQVWQQKVALGARYGDRVEIREGVDADLAVVESGVGFLTSGVTVRVAASALSQTTHF